MACPQAEGKTVLILISWQLWELDQIYSMSTSGGENSDDRDQLASQELDSSLWHVHKQNGKQC